MKIIVIIETRAARDIEEASGWLAERLPESAACVPTLVATKVTGKVDAKSNVFRIFP
jgi:hypothetical protein